MINVAVTAPQGGVTANQLWMAGEWLFKIEDIATFHHGDCIGGDAQLDAEMHRARYGYPEQGRIIIHPGCDRNGNMPKRAWCKDYDEIREPKWYIDRNHDMVNECEYLIGFPATYHSVPRSGTCATINYALKMGKHVIIVFPDGTVGSDWKEER